uniref:ARAD1D18304p n=1 Tax=Blastobotrys adeninivorans TaxID=409370 RepID=A0A060T9X6_BLAAD
MDGMKVVNPLDPELVPLYDPEFVEVYNRTGAYLPSSADVTPQESRQARAKSMPQLDRSTVSSVTDYPYGEYDEQKVRVIVPKGDRPSTGWPLYIYIHGGGWTLGNLDTEAILLGSLANAVQSVAISVNYRHAPESPFPAAAEDAWAAFEYIQANGDRLGLDLSKVVIGGPSAGANLTEVVTQKLVSHNEQASSPYKQLLHQVLVIPPSDMSDRSKYPSLKKYAKSATLGAREFDNFLDQYSGGQDIVHDVRASPLLNDDKVFAKLPSATVIIAGMDPLSDEGKAYAQKLEKNGVNVDLTVLERVPHGFMFFPIEKTKQYTQLVIGAVYRAIHGKSLQ